MSTINITTPVRMQNGRVPWVRVQRRVTANYHVKSMRSLANYLRANPDPNRADNRLAFNRKGGVVR